MLISESLSKHFFNMNPPHFHFIILPLAFFSPIVALSLWGLLSFFCLILSIILIIKENKFRVTPLRFFTGVLFLLSLACTGTTFVTGQISFLLLFVFTLAWIEARRGRWSTSAIYVGLMAGIKPFMLIFFPYFLMKRKFRATSIACSMCILLTIGGSIFFGWNSYVSWLKSISQVDWAWLGMNGSIQGVLTRMFSPTPHFSPIVDIPWLVKPLWYGLAGAIFLLTMRLIMFRFTLSSVDRSFAFLLLAALLISPLGWIYYAILLLGPGSNLISGWLTHASRVKSELRTNHLSRICLLFVPSLAMFLPFSVVLLFEPDALATLSLGSAYFWGLFGGWLLLATDIYTHHESYMEDKLEITGVASNKPEGQSSTGSARRYLHRE